MAERAPTMKDLTKLAREVLGSDYRVRAVYYPRGVCCDRGYGGPGITIRTGDYNTGKRWMRDVLLAWKAAGHG